MQSNEILGHLMIKGTPASEIARKLAVSRQAVYYTIHNQTKSSRIRRAIAQAISRPLHEIWPDPERNHL